MKKTLILLVGFVALSAQAVSFSWTSAEQIKFNGTTLNTVGNTANAYLVYLGTDGAWSFGDDITGTLANITDSNVASSATRTSGSNALKGKITQTSYGPDGNQGYAYGVVLKYTDGNSDVWYNLSSDIYIVPSVADNATGVSHAFEFSNATGGEVPQLGSSQVGGGWYKVVPIPEPGSAAMALLGLGLLIRRRKA